MKLQDITLEAGNHFVAMEYYALLLNRTYLVLITQSHLIGIVANGLVSVRGGPSGSLTDILTTKMAVEGDLNNPFSYVSEKYLLRINQLDFA